MGEWERTWHVLVQDAGRVMSVSPEARPALFIPFEKRWGQLAEGTVHCAGSRGRRRPSWMSSALAALIPWCSQPWTTPVFAFASKRSSDRGFLTPFAFHSFEGSSPTCITFTTFRAGATALHPREASWHIVDAVYRYGLSIVRL